MDEPLSNLDAKLRAQTRLELIRLHRRLQTTVLYVTHDQVEAMTMGRRIAVMDRGRLQQVDSPQNIYDRPANRFVAEFVGSPAMSLFRGPIRSETDGRLSVEASGVKFSLDARQSQVVRAKALPEIIVGVRPEHLELAEQIGEREAVAAFDARVDVVESLGNEIHATLLVGDRTIIARLPADAPVESGAMSRFAIAPEHLLLFDCESERRLE
jgi:multiple sugar transport system ATP-binding protein